MNFYDILEEETEGMAKNPYAAKSNGEWIEGLISIDFLNEFYGKYETYEDIVANSMTEGHKLYFEWLKEKGILN